MTTKNQDNNLEKLKTSKEFDSAYMDLNELNENGESINEVLKSLEGLTSKLKTDIHEKRTDNNIIDLDFKNKK